MYGCNQLEYELCSPKKKKFNFNEGTKIVALERLLYIESRLHKLEFLHYGGQVKKNIQYMAN